MYLSDAMKKYFFRVMAMAYFNIRRNLTRRVVSAMTKMLSVML